MRRLMGLFPDLAPEVVQRTVHASHERFAGSPIRDFIPVLVAAGPTPGRLSSGHGLNVRRS